VYWPVEDIPDEDSLYYRVHFNDIDSYGHPKPGAFRNNPKDSSNSGMSVNWARYATAEQARQNARKPVGEYSVVRMAAGKVRDIPNQTVVHEPLPDNRSHSEVFGVKDPEARVKLLEICYIELHFDKT
jgi:hypothetical protein